MTTKPSDAPWADEPFKLLPMPFTYVEDKSHTSFMAATNMTHSHNCMLRALNAIIQQGPHVAEHGQAGYAAADVLDFLHYVKVWTKMAEHHHTAEETTMFPLLGKLAGDPELMSKSSEQHDVIHKGTTALRDYAEAGAEKPETYKWSEVKAVIDDFAPALLEHLTTEIEDLLALKRLDSAELAKVLMETRKYAKANDQEDLQLEIFPMVLGSCDKTYQGGNDFPHIDEGVPEKIRAHAEKTHTGAWRFNACDLFGKPVPLQMLPENRVAVA